LATDRQTDEQMDSTDALSPSRCRERRLNKVWLYYACVLWMCEVRVRIRQNIVLCVRHYTTTTELPIRW